MAYMNQEKKAKIAAVVAPILKKYGVKATLSVRNHSSISLNIKSATFDMLADSLSEVPKTYIDVNVYHYKTQFKGKTLNFLKEVVPALNLDNFDNSDSMTDYFHVGHYVDVNIGCWNKPFEVK